MTQRQFYPQPRPPQSPKLYHNNPMPRSEVSLTAHEVGSLTNMPFQSGEIVKGSLSFYEGGSRIEYIPYERKVT